MQSKLSWLMKSVGFGVSDEQIRQGLNELIPYAQMQQEMKKEITRLNNDKEELISMHIRILESMEILLYQRDYDELKEQITLNKKNRLSATASFQQNTLQALNQPVESSGTISEEIQEALAVIESQQPFDKKEQVWLSVVYRVDTSTSDLHHVTVEEAVQHIEQCSSISNFSEISMTEGCVTESNKKRGKSTYKSKSHSKISKTSLKRTTAQQQNVESGFKKKGSNVKVTPFELMNRKKATLKDGQKSAGRKTILNCF